MINLTASPCRCNCVLNTFTANSISWTVSRESRAPSGTKDDRPSAVSQRSDYIVSLKEAIRNEHDALISGSPLYYHHYDLIVQELAQLVILRLKWKKVIPYPKVRTLVILYVLVFRYHLPPSIVTKQELRIVKRLFVQIEDCTENSGVRPRPENYPIGLMKMLREITRGFNVIQGGFVTQPKEREHEKLCIIHVGLQI